MTEIRASQVFVRADLENMLLALLTSRPDWIEPIGAVLTAIGSRPFEARDIQVITGNCRQLETRQ